MSQREAARRIRIVFDKLGVRGRRELRAKMTASEWRHDLDRIRAFIETHGHSQVPEDYWDEQGPLYPAVDNIRRHHAGLPGTLKDGPYPGIDYEAELDLLPGWEW